MHQSSAYLWNLLQETQKSQLEMAFFIKNPTEQMLAK